MSPFSRRRDQRVHGESGFTLVELIVTMMVIGTVLLGLIGVQLKALTTTTDAKQRQQATAAGNLVMERLRTLPYDKLIKGVHPNTLTGDPNAALIASYGEALIADNGAETTLPPLVVGTDKKNLTTTADTASSSVNYASRAYVSRAAAATVDSPYSLTVVTTWSSAATKGQTKRIVLRSEAFAPDGCLGTATRPFSGPCQAFLYADAGMAGGSIGIAGVAGAKLVTGLDATSASMSLLQGSTGIAAEQTTAIKGRAVTSGGVANNADVVLSPSFGQLEDRTLAGDDPANQTAAPPTDTGSVTQSSSPLVLDGTNAKLTVTPASSDSGTLHSTASASGTACRDLDSTAMSGTPCSSTTVTPGGTATVALDYKNIDSLNLPSFDMASVAASTIASQAWSGRYVTTVGASRCTTLSGAGCVAAGAKRTLGTAVAGLLPSVSGSTVSPNMADGLVKVTGYSDSLVTENGPNQTGVAPTALRSGTLRYRNSSGVYADVNLTPTSNATYSLGTAMSTAPTGAGDTVSLQVSGTVTVKPVATTNTAPSGCVDACIKQSRLPSVSTALRYRLIRGATVLSDLELTMDLGSLVSTTTYKAAPSA